VAELNNKIKKQEQRIARAETSLALEKLKKRRADTRRKIELGGLVVKSGMDGLNKSVVLGALTHALGLIEKEEGYSKIFESIGDTEFLKE
jgi:hypothetical protein